MEKTGRVYYIHDIVLSVFLIQDNKLSDWIIDKEPTTDSESSRHKKCESCGKMLETEATPKLYLTATTDTHGEAVAGGYPVIVTDTLSLFLWLT